MKKLEFSTSKGEWLLVDDDEHGLITDKEQANRLINAWGTDNVERDLDRLELICKLSDITEEQASDVVDSEYVDFIDKYLYRDYKSKNAKEVFNDNLSAIESLHSLIKSKGVNLFENPWRDCGDDDVVNFENKQTFYNPYLFKKI